MQEHSLIRILTIDEIEAHYDINTHPHGHLYVRMWKYMTLIQI